MRLLLIAFLFLSACGRNPVWQYHEIITDCHQFDSANLTSCVENKFSGIEVQFLRGTFGTLGYLNVFMREIPPIPNEPKNSWAIIEIDGIQRPFKGIRMECGQRLLLPHEATVLLITALSENRPVIVYMDSYMAEVSSDNFSRYYNKLQKIPIL